MSAEPHTADPYRAPLHLMLLVMAMTAVGPLSLNIVIPALPGLVHKFSADIGTVQLTLSLYFFGLACSQLVLGPLSDRFGRRPVVLAGLGLATIASAIAAAAWTIEALVVARVIQAFGASTGTVLGRAIIRDLYERDRAAAMMGRVVTVTIVAPMLSPLLGGVLDTAFGWQMIFLFMAGSTCAVLVWCYIALPETRPQSIKNADKTLLWSETRWLLADRSFLVYLFFGALGSGSFFCLLGGAPLVVITLMDRSSAEYGIWFILAALGYMGGSAFAGHFSPRFGVNKMICIGAVIQCVGGAIALAITPLLANPAAIFLPQILVAFGNGILLPNATAGAVSVRLRVSGLASGIVGFMQWMIGGVLAHFTGVLVATTGSMWPLQLAVFACPLVLVASLFLIRKAK